MLTNRFMAPLLVFLLAALPLVWMRIMASDWGNMAYFHIGALALMVCVAADPRARSGVFEAAGKTRHIWIAVALLFLVTLFSFLKVDPPFPASDLVRQGFYALSALAAGGAILALYHANQLRHLVWAAPAAIVTFLYFMYVSLIASGANPFRIISLAISSGNPDALIFPLFRSAFNGGTAAVAEVRANARHDVVFALLLAALASGIGLVDAGRRARQIAKAAIATIVLVAIFTFSRSAWLAMFLMAALFLSATTARTNKGIVIWALIGQVFAAAMVYLWAFTPVVSMLSTRLFASASYEGRSSSAAALLERARDHLWTGVPDLVADDWAHNLFVDYLSAAGIAGGLVALFLILATVAAIVRYWLIAVGSPQTRVLHLLCASFLVLPLVRFVTAPKGHPSMSSWVAIGFASALMAVLARQLAVGRAARRPVAPRPDGGFVGAPVVS